MLGTERRWHSTSINVLLPRVYKCKIKRFCITKTAQWYLQYQLLNAILHAVIPQCPPQRHINLSSYVTPRLMPYIHPTPPTLLRLKLSRERPSTLRAYLTHQLVLDIIFPQDHLNLQFICSQPLYFSIRNLQPGHGCVVFPIVT